MLFEFAAADFPDRSLVKLLPLSSVTGEPLCPLSLPTVLHVVTEVGFVHTYTPVLCNKWLHFEQGWNHHLLPTPASFPPLGVPVTNYMYLSAFVHCPIFVFKVSDIQCNTAATTVQMPQEQILFLFFSSQLYQFTYLCTCMRTTWPFTSVLSCLLVQNLSWDSGFVKPYGHAVTCTVHCAYM